MNPSSNRAPRAHLLNRAARAFVLAALLPFALAHTVFAAPMDEWTKPSLAADVIVSPNDLIFANGKYWAVGASGRMQHSANGLDWTAYNTPATAHLTSIAYGNGRYVAVGYQMMIMSSSNGTDWNVHEQDTSTSTGWHQVAFINNQFIVVGRQGKVRLSANGTDWTPATMSGSNFYPRQVAWGNGLYVAVGGQDGVRNVQTSPDAITWTSRTTTVPGILNSVAFFNGLFVAGGQSYLATSPDGATWTKLSGIQFPYEDGITVYGLKALNGRLFAFGEYGTLLSSANGTEWTTHTTETTYGVRALDYNGERLLAIHSGATISSGGHAYSDPWAPVGGSDTPQNPAPETPGTPTTPEEPAPPSTPTNPVPNPPSEPEAPGEAPTTPGTPSEPGTGGNTPNTPENPSTPETPNTPENPGTPQTPSPSEPETPSTPTIPTSPDDETSESGQSDTTTARLVNLSTRAWVGTGDNLMISGFVVKGSSPKTVLVRAIGPTLSQLGITTPLADPQIRVLNAQGVEVGFNDNWSAGANHTAISTAAATVGAFSLPEGSKDAAMLVTLQPGIHTIHITGVGSSTGIALAEVYDCVSGEPCRLVNISSRTLVGNGDEVAITGFVVSGAGSRDLLIRGIGPSLAAQGISGAIANPKIALYDSHHQLVAQNDDWGTAPDVASLVEIMTEVGAFALPSGSADAAMVVTVGPGLYTIMISGAGATAGLSLLELYEIQ